MVKQIHVKGFDEFQNVTKSLKSTDVAVCLFTGAEDSAGKNWCPDCVAAKPFIQEALKSAPANATFITCEVGDRAYWKNMGNPFRTTPSLNIQSVPTLLRWGSPKKLDGAQCENPSLIAMLFEEE
uniref:Thioredoxin domain-containing protein 17 n=1 Tax=Ornithodoros turicata TaxID=34597 RepID=A0A2R5LFN1_9ACAR